MTDSEIIESAIALVDEGMHVTFPVRGWSMLPFIIGGKESVVLQKPDNVHVGHVVLAWVDGCRYVVHRIIAIEDDKVTLMGDGNIAGKEYCLLKDLKALASHVVDRRGRQHDLYSKWRRMAVRLWWWLRPVRRYLLFIYKRVKRIR
ncbi:MAG: S24/S26 family peptidase [Prevotella sp.]|nr:S24/S26 family peptidase [Prevotella sp.]